MDFSTITLQIYEGQSVKRELVGNNKDIRAYQPGLGMRISDAFKTGWEVFESFLVLIIQLWWLILLLLTAWLVIAKFLPKFKLRKQLAL
jgi:hypothetical protein